MPLCSIRPYEAGDAQALWEAARESVGEVSRWLSWCHPRYSTAEAAEWIAGRAPLYAEGREYHFAIVDPGGRLLGGCGINQINRVHRFANLGYWVRSSATGHGVATEAARQAADFAFGETDFLRLEIVCAVDNVASQRVAQRAGAEREGVLRHRLLVRGQPRDAVMYSLVRGGVGSAEPRAGGARRAEGPVGRLTPAAIKPTVTVADVEKLDVRVGTIVAVDEIPKSVKLLKLAVDFGDHERTILAGMKAERANPREIVGVQALFVVNLEPKRMAGELSQGMLFDVGFADGIPPVLAVPERAVPNGTRAG